MAVSVVSNRGVSITLACRAFQISQGCYLYGRKLNDENVEITEWLMKLTTNRRTWGFGVQLIRIIAFLMRSYNRAGIRRLPNDYYNAFRKRQRLAPKQIVTDILETYGAARC